MFSDQHGSANKLRTALLVWLDGTFQALAFYKAIRDIVHDPVIGMLLAQCCAINGALLLGSMAIGHVWKISFTQPASTPLELPQSQGSIFQALGTMPTFCACLAVNGSWCSSIAKRVLQLQQRRDTDHNSTTTAAAAHGSLSGSGHAALQHQPATGIIGDQIYRIVICVVYILQTWMASHIPFIGGVLNWFMMSWLFAFYCFDFKWSLVAVPLSVRIQFFERHWAFFGGYGSLLSSITALLPHFIAATTVAAVLPVSIILACGDMRPVERVIRVSKRYGGSPPGSLRIFWLTDILCAALLRHAKNCLPFLRLLGFR